ncbi:hypothetical protein F7725_022723 [Dissostichus mawsoni]|uniref:ZP-C domain-containing protein n=1 Tax=Dissostichus mawsoni TaxID=36200 RepID=A0A7J5Z2X0_DISMA|nr:hypothetical protein F7725_022723 [Dissostichus mawsoni]
MRDPVYVEVQLLEKTDPNLVLTLGRCWTTTSPNPHSLPQWDIHIDGCSFTAAQPCALVERVAPVNHHASEKGENLGLRTRAWLSQRSWFLLDQ